MHFFIPLKPSTFGYLKISLKSKSLSLEIYRLSSIEFYLQNPQGICTHEILCVRFVGSSVHLYVCLSVCPFFVNPSFCLCFMFFSPVFLLVFLPFYLFIDLFVSFCLCFKCPSYCPVSSPFACTCFSLSVFFICQSVLFSICLSVSLFFDLFLFAISRKKMSFFVKVSMNSG